MKYWGIAVVLSAAILVAAIWNCDDTYSPTPTPTPAGTFSTLAPGAGVITPKATGEYELTSVYSPDKVDVSIKGAPQATMYRWGAECYLKVVWPEESAAPYKTFENNTVKWRDGDVEIQISLFDPTAQSERGGCEFNVILWSKPASNQIALDLYAKGLKFYYQPELTAQEIAEGAVRPDNIVGSYAVYHESKRGNEYKTGKAFHIFRPQPVDSKDTTVWADLEIVHVEGNHYRQIITIPQKFLDEAVYPVYHACGDTFGDTTPGGTGTTGYGERLYGIHATPASGGEVTDMRVYGHDSGDPVKMVLVEDTGKTIITNGVTGATSLPASEDWVTGTFGTNPTVTASKYWLGAIGDVNWTYYYDTGSAGDSFSDTSNSYASPTDPTDGNFNESRLISIYATYTPGGTPTPTPTPTPAPQGQIY